MECDICGGGRSQRSKFHCPACARAALYPLRLEHARVLLERSRLEKRLEVIIPQTQDTPTANLPLPAGDRDNAASRKLRREHELANIRASRNRVDTIHRKSEELRKQIEACKDELGARKTKLSARRSELKAAHANLESSMPEAVDPVKKAVQRSGRRLGRVTEDLCHARSWLCYAAASISQMQKASASQPPIHGSRDKQPSADEHYEIAGVSIPRLQDLNAVNLDHLNAVLSHIVCLLHLTCIYLGIRLPAEILQPSQNAPAPSIRPPDSSYPILEASASEHSSSTGSSPTASRFSIQANDTAKPKPRQRPLSVSPSLVTPVKKLSNIAKEDPKQFNLLVEGLAYLAWDIAWLCRSQGVDIGESWERICDIGRNLHALFVVAAGQGQQRKSPPHRTDTATDPIFGLRSHNTSAARLPSTADVGPGSLLSPQQIRLALRQHLLNDMQGAEWELLEEEDYGGHVKAAAPEDVVLVGKGKRRAAEPLGGELGEVIGRGDDGGLGLDVDEEAKGEDGDEEILARTAYAEGSGREETRRGNGWMKVKARN